MNGHKQATAGAPAPPPKDQQHHPATAAAAATSSAISDRLVPAIAGAATSAKEAATSVVSSASGGGSQGQGTHSSKQQQNAVPHSRVGSQLADYVLVFQAIAKKHIRSHTKVPASERAQVAQEYDELIERISRTGLSVTTREGAKGTGQILVFVKASDTLLDRLARQEALTDYLHGVLSVEPPQQRSSSLAIGGACSQRPPLAITPASRVRYVHTLLTLPSLANKAVEEAASTGDSADAARAPAGAGLRVGHSDFPRLVDMSAIHDPAYNSAWVQRWSHTAPTAVLSGIGLEDLDSVREHFGEDVGLYFGFLNFYFQALAPLALWGGAFWAFGKPYSPIYSFGLVSWACLTVEAWRMRERKLSVRWGTAGVDRVERRRESFKPRTTRIDPATGQEEEVFEWWRRELRVVLTLPAMLVFASLLAATMTLMFVVEIFVGHLYHGPLRQAVPFIPTALFVVAVPQIMAAWQATAASLTGWENHYSAKAHDYSLTLKRFALQGMVAYGALFLSAFVYIPFGEAIMDDVVARGFFADSIQTAIAEGKISSGNGASSSSNFTSSTSGVGVGAKGIDFHINPDRMHTQLFAVSVTSQAIGAFTELVLPLLMRKVKEWRSERRRDDAGNKKDGGRSGSSSPVDSATATAVSQEEKEEAKFIRRVQKELELPPYDLFGDYAEMATQFGYITLWSVIWPLSPVMGFVNNFFELRADAAKICLNQRRPVPVRAETVGPWLEVLGFIAWLSALSNSALVYLFQPTPTAGTNGHSAYETMMRNHIHPSSSSSSGGSALSFTRLLPSWLPQNGASGALVCAILVALSSEHAYALVRAGVRHLIERAVWRGSQEEMLVRRREWWGRVESVKARAHSLVPPHAAAEEKERKGGKGEEELRGSFFWKREKDVGAQLIRESGKVE